MFRVRGTIQIRLKSFDKKRHSFFISHFGLSRLFHVEILPDEIFGNRDFCLVQIFACRDFCLIEIFVRQDFSPSRFKPLRFLLVEILPNDILSVDLFGVEIISRRYFVQRDNCVEIFAVEILAAILWAATYCIEESIVGSITFKNRNQNC